MATEAHDVDYLKHPQATVYQPPRDRLLSSLYDAMVHTSALYSQSQQDVLDTIRTQFTLSEDTLLHITQVFLREAAEGLATYGQPMAMMYVLIVAAYQTRVNGPQSDVRQVSSRRFRDRVCLAYLPRAAMLMQPNSTFLALDLGGTNLYVNTQTVYHSCCMAYPVACAR